MNQKILDWAQNRYRQMKATPRMWAVTNEGYLATLAVLVEIWAIGACAWSNAFRRLYDAAGDYDQDPNALAKDLDQNFVDRINAAFEEVTGWH